jgi:hypothetical protein
MVLPNGQTEDEIYIYTIMRYILAFLSARNYNA